jgi:hypothetical protein
VRGKKYLLPKHIYNATQHIALFTYFALLYWQCNYTSASATFIFVNSVEYMTAQR